MEIVICRDFSETPNARYRAEGPDSGEEFRESLLEPKYILARNIYMATASIYLGLTRSFETDLL